MEQQRFANGRLADKVAIVTGAGQGLGEALATRLWQEGCRVAIADMNGPKAEEVAARLGGLGFCVDVTNEDAMADMARKVVEAYGRIDLLVCNAAIVIANAIEEMPLTTFMKVVTVNMGGYYASARAVVPHMKAQGSGCIVQINSKSGKKGSAKNSAYAASKFGGVGLTQSLALELAGEGIRVNAICPGNLLDSPLWVNSLYEQYGRNQGLTAAEVRKKYEAQVPMGRGCTYDDIAGVLVFLASDDAKYMTGQAINVTGGQQMN